MVQQFGSARP